MLRIETIHYSTLEGELYLPEKRLNQDVVVVVLGGSGGGLRHRPIAQQLAQDGIPALTLAYFGWGNLPKTLENIPLEYFAQAVTYLRQHAELASATIVLMGHSRGGELVLQLASTYNYFAGVIATNASHVRWGATGKNAPSWLLAGQPLPVVEPKTVAEEVVWTQNVEGREYMVLRDWYQQQLINNPTVEAAVIPVEKIQAPILLFSGNEDMLWPSVFFANQIEARIKAHTASFAITNQHYEGVGHIIPLPNVIPTFHAWHEAIDSGIAYGGQLAATMMAADDRWRQVLSFVENLR